MSSNALGKVYLGMSGGVDSSISAALLLRAGYDVSGIFIRTWTPEWLSCDWEEERRDAMRVAAHLGIPLSTLDLSREYKEGVVDYLLDEYRRGRTPNPDVMCNKSIKFGAFLDFAMREGADLVSTGHYARSHESRLLAGVDRSKDQSYFLWTLTQEILSHTLFPIGGYEKREVRELARDFGIPVADKKDSQGICFLGAVDMKDFLRHYVDVKGGDVLDMVGQVVGRHEGAILYTLGERHGFTVRQRLPDEGAHFVVAKDIERNTITVATKAGETAASVREIVLRDINWITSPVTGQSYGARIRYRQPLAACTITGKTVTFEVPQRAVTSGQSCVVYDGDICLGGGVII